VEAVLECARNLACAGAEPLGLTNCLNFGNPEKPHIAWQLTEAVRGLGDTCRALGVPVVGGNVSLYNEGLEGPIFPTPVVGMVGWLPDPERVPAAGFAEEGHAIALLGPFAPSLLGSELEKLRGGLSGELPEVDLERQARALGVLREAVRSGLVASAHDVSEGGLAVALAECCIAGGRGAWVKLPSDDMLFGEGPGGVVVSGPPGELDKLAETAAESGFMWLGQVGGDLLVASAPAASLSVPVAQLASTFESGIPAKFS
jgi:phosphoribosylformylglycinamidine synthase